MNINRMSHSSSGFTLTELMVVIVILCCLATWVPMAWLTPDKPKDLKAIEHLRAHAYMHQLYFSMFQTYPTFEDSTFNDLTLDGMRYARLIFQKNPAIASVVQYVDPDDLTDFDALDLDQNEHAVPLVEANTNLNQISNDNTVGENTWKEDEFCQKNSPIGNEDPEDVTDEANKFCEIDDINFDLEYRTIAVGHPIPQAFMNINGNGVMIPHRCLGLMAPSGTIYIIHIAGGETLSTSHIPASIVNKIVEPSDTGVLVAALAACENFANNSGSTTIQGILTDAGFVNVPENIAQPGF